MISQGFQHMPSEDAVVAFIGLGQMGLPMSARLLAAGYRVRGADVAAAAREAFAARGGAAFTTARAAAEGATVVITMLPTGAVVRDALLGADGALPALQPGRLIIDMSSSAPTDTVALGRDLSTRGHRLVDAPVSGGVRRAVDGTLAIMAGGAADDVAEAAPLLRAMGAKLFETGRLGSGHAMKALNNFVSAAGAVAAMEAVLVGGRFGLDPAVIVDVLNASTGRNNTTEVKMKQFVLSRNWASGFSMALMAKDVGIAAGLAASLGLDAPMLAAAATQWAEASAALGSGADHTEIMRYVEQRAGEQ